MPLFKSKQTLSEMEEEAERKEAEDRLEGLNFSIAQKRELARRLKEQGLAPKHFGLDFRKIYRWLRSH